MAEYAGRGDPRRSIALLWGVVDAPTRGPKQGLTVEAIAAAGIAVADAEGLEAVSMRKVAERLGKSAMALYTYVPGKGELLDLMLDTVLTELPTEYPTDNGWRAALEDCARVGWQFYERHPWVLQVSGSRAALGPHELDAYEAQLRLFDGVGLSGVEVMRAVGVVASFVRGAAKAVADARTAEAVTGISDNEWWEARAPLLDALPGDVWNLRYPTMTRLQGEQAFDQADRPPDDTSSYTVREALDVFEFGLQRLLDGLAAYVDERAPETVTRRR